MLRRLAHPAGPGEPNGPLTVVVTPVRSLLQPIVAGLGDLEPVTLQTGQECELDDLLARLVEIGYARADLVGSRGEIAVRGGIVDVFPPTEEHPLRIEFFGDTIEEIRYFKVADQRSIGPAESFVVDTIVPPRSKTAAAANSAATAGRRFTHLAARSSLPTGRARTGSPRRKRRRSSAKARAAP